jgi:putative intracellular protease/amidase
MKILMVLTSHDQLGNTGEKTGVFKDAGAEVVLASPKGGQPPLDPKSDTPDAQTANTDRFRKDAEATAALASTHKLSEVVDGKYDAVFYPGGHGPLWDLAEDRDSIRLIEASQTAGIPVGTVCHAPAALRHVKSADGSPLVQGKSVTGFTNTEEAAVGLTDVVPFLVEDMLKSNGGKYSKKDDWQPYAITDGKLVTGQNPASSETAAEAVLALLQ